MMTDKYRIKSYLQELKQVIRVWDVFFINRPKNSVQHLADLNITANRRKEIILNLEVKDYSEGPIEETQHGGNKLDERL